MWRTPSRFPADRSPVPGMERVRARRSWKIGDCRADFPRGAGGTRSLRKMTARPVGFPRNGCSRAAAGEDGSRAAVRGNRDMHGVTNCRGARSFVTLRGSGVHGVTNPGGRSQFVTFCMFLGHFADHAGSIAGRAWEVESVPAGGDVCVGQDRRPPRLAVTAPPPRTVAPVRSAVRRWVLGNVARDLLSRTLS